VIRLNVTVQGGRLELDKKLLRQTMRAAGTEVAAVARGLIRGSAGGGRLYRGHRASAPGQPPASQSGQLASSIRVKVYKSGEGVTIRDTAQSRGGSGAPYALFLEAGAYGGRHRRPDHRKQTAAMRKARAIARGETRMMEPRPFLSTALDMREASIAQRVAASINQGMKFVRQKA
jgi:hypothetical protein